MTPSRRMAQTSRFAEKGNRKRWGAELALFAINSTFAGCSSGIVQQGDTSSSQFIAATVKWNASRRTIIGLISRGNNSYGLNFGAGLSLGNRKNFLWWWGIFCILMGTGKYASPSGKSYSLPARAPIWDRDAFLNPFLLCSFHQLKVLSSIQKKSDILNAKVCPLVLTHFLVDDALS